MIYKILNKLFGWDYIQTYYFPDVNISRVQVDGMRRVWHWQVYRRHSSLDIEYKPTNKEAIIIERPEDVIWLTCSPNKYFPPSVPKPTNTDVLTALKRACRFIDSIPYYIDPDGTVNIKDLLAGSYKEVITLRQTIEQLEGTK